MALNCLPFQLNSLMIVETLSIFTELNFFVPIPPDYVSLRLHVSWVSWLEILSHSQFIPLIIYSVFPRHLSPQFLMIPVISSHAGRQGAFPHLEAPQEGTPLDQVWKQAQLSLSSPHSSFFIPLPRSIPFSLFPSPFLPGVLLCPIWSTDVSWVHCIPRHSQAPSAW